MKEELVPSVLFHSECQGCSSSGQLGVLRVWRRDSHCTTGISPAPRPWGSSCSSFPKPPLVDLMWCLLGPPQVMESVRRPQGADTARDTRSGLLFSRNQMKRLSPSTRKGGLRPKVWICGVCLHPRDSGEVKGEDLPSSTSHTLWR